MILNACQPNIKSIKPFQTATPLSKAPQTMTNSVITSQETIAPIPLALRQSLAGISFSSLNLEMFKPELYNQVSDAIDTASDWNFNARDGKVSFVSNNTAYTLETNGSMKYVSSSKERDSYFMSEEKFESLWEKCATKVGQQLKTSYASLGFSEDLDVTPILETIKPKIPTLEWKRESYNDMYRFSAKVDDNTTIQVEQNYKRSIGPNRSHYFVTLFQGADNDPQNKISLGASTKEEIGAMESFRDALRKEIGSLY